VCLGTDERYEHGDQAQHKKAHTHQGVGGARVSRDDRVSSYERIYPIHTFLRLHRLAERTHLLLVRLFKGTRDVAYALIARVECIAVV